MTGGRRVWGITLLFGATIAAEAFGQAPTNTPDAAKTSPSAAATADSEVTDSAATKAAAAFSRAEEAFAQGNYGDAARAFDLADRLLPHASVIFNAAVAWDHAGDSPRAATNYKRAIDREGLSEAQAAQARKRLVELGERLVYVHITQPLGTNVSVAHVQNETIPTRFFLEPGNYELTLEEGPLRRVEQLAVAPGKSAQFELDPLLAPPSQRGAAPPTPREPTNPNAAQEVSGWVLLGVGVVAAGAAVYMGQEAVVARDEYFKSGRQDRDSYNRAFNLRLGSNVATAGAGVVGATGLVLLLTAPTIRF